MSGITPLLDTLLHQVLGKRVDTPPPRDLNQPVKPTSPVDAPRALHSDSRLDARTHPSPLQETLLPRGTPTEAGAGPTRQPGPAPASTQTRLSGAGRTIADLLMRFPAPPSIVTTRAPLITSGPDATAEAVATRLEASVRDSGLFYESHLARWYRGELPRQQLEREPQMWRTLRFTPVQGQLVPSSTAGPVTPSAATPGSPASATPPPPAADTQMATQAAREAGVGSAPRPAAPAGGDPVHDSLQGIVRHQLEMLVTPTLRWEGDIWSGLFMALMIQLPVGERGRDGEPGESDGEGNAEGHGWRSEIDLDVAGLGRLQASVWMQQARLEIDLRAPEDALGPLEAGLEHLKSRLAGHGFEEVGVTLAALEEDSDRAVS